MVVEEELLLLLLRDADDARTSAMASREPRRLLVYLHGFRSSPTMSAKARAMRAAVDEAGGRVQMVAPRLPANAKAAVRVVQDVVAAAGVDETRDVTLVGSSLGGFYAAVLAEKWRCRAVMVNPAMDAAAVLEAHVGRHARAYHSADPFEFSRKDWEDLENVQRTCMPPRASPPQNRYWLVVGAADRDVDPSAAMEWCGPLAKRDVVPHGDHGLEKEFAALAPRIVAFARSPFPAPGSSSSGTIISRRRA